MSNNGQENSNNTADSGDKAKAQQLASDSLFKRVMCEPVAAKEFLEYYLPASFKEKVDIETVTIERESYVRDDLRKKLSDIVYSVSLKQPSRAETEEAVEKEHGTTECSVEKVATKPEKAFIYILLEHQSSSDYWISFRLWQYVLLLCERHKEEGNSKRKKKLPLVYPMVVYAGEKKHSAPKSFWELFKDPVQAKAIMGDEYLLVDLQKASDEEIEQKQHLGMMEYMLKHIHARDMIKLWESFLTRFKTSIELDRQSGFVYIKWLMWYTDVKVTEDKQAELVRLINNHLKKEEQEGLMRTIAEKYIDEGIAQGIQIGKQEGIQIGEAKGKTEGKLEIAKKLLVKGSDPAFVAVVTGLDESVVLSLIKSK